LDNREFIIKASDELKEAALQEKVEQRAL